MKILLLISLVAFTVSCAHHHKEYAHHDHSKEFHKKGKMFNKHCAMSVSEGDNHVKGNEDFVYDHGGMKYYFSSKAKMNKFKQNIEKNISNAKKNWSVGDRR
jgi:YHS domain-containing protein